MDSIPHHQDPLWMHARTHASKQVLPEELLAAHARPDGTINVKNATTATQPSDPKSQSHHIHRHCYQPPTISACISCLMPDVCQPATYPPQTPRHPSSPKEVEEKEEEDVAKNSLDLNNKRGNTSAFLSNSYEAESLSPTTSCLPRSLPPKPASSYQETTTCEGSEANTNQPKRADPQNP